MTFVRASVEGVIRRFSGMTVVAADGARLTGSLIVVSVPTITPAMAFGRSGAEYSV
jgi:hypothetical protein